MDEKWWFAPVWVLVIIIFWLQNSCCWSRNALISATTAVVGWLVGRIEPFRMVINQGQQCSARKKILQGVRYDDIVWSWEGSRLHHINLELEIGWEKYDNFGCRSSSQGHWWWYYCVAKWNSRVLDTVDTNTTVTLFSSSHAQ